MVKRIGVKDLEGNNVCVIDHKNKIPEKFYENYQLKNIKFNVGDNMAFMTVKKIKTED